MKIIIINTQSVNHNNATGITLRSIFRNFDKKELYEIHLQPCYKAEDAIDIVSRQANFSVCPLRFIVNKLFKGAASPVSLGVAREKHKVGLKKRIAMMIDFEPMFVSRKMLKEIRAFSPDCIYTLGNGIDIMKLTYKLSKKISVPILLHFMDNWSASHRFGPDLFPIHLKSTQKWLKKLYERSKCAITISDKMAEEYETRWGIKHFSLMNAVNVSEFQCEFNPDNKVRVFSYAGGLHLNRYKSLLQVAKALDQYNEKNKMNLVLNIYTDSKSKELYGEHFLSIRCVSVLPAVNHNEIVNIYRNSDVLIHIESFDYEQREFIMYSLSTKISEYLATGKPIFLYAPDDIFVNEYLKKNSIAYIASSQQDIYNTIDALVNSTNLKDMSERAVSLARQKHDFMVCNDFFRQALSYTIFSRDKNVEDL